MATRVKKRHDTSTNRESDKIIVRLPDGMRAALAAKAASNGRSMTAEVVSALSTHLTGETEQESLKQSWEMIGKSISDLQATQRSLKETMRDFKKLTDDAMKK